jgi:hypothetical protein
MILAPYRISFLYQSINQEHHAHNFSFVQVQSQLTLDYLLRVNTIYFKVLCLYDIFLFSLNSLKLLKFFSKFWQFIPKTFFSFSILISKYSSLNLNICKVKSLNNIFFCWPKYKVYLFLKCKDDPAVS